MSVYTQYWLRNDSGHLRPDNNFDNVSLIRRLLLSRSEMSVYAKSIGYAMTLVIFVLIIILIMYL